MKNKELKVFVEMMLIIGVFAVNTAAVIFTMTTEITTNHAIAYALANIGLSYLTFEINKGGN